MAVDRVRVVCVNQENNESLDLENSAIGKNTMTFQGQLAQIGHYLLHLHAGGERSLLSGHQSTVEVDT